VLIRGTVASAILVLGVTPSVAEAQSIDGRAPLGQTGFAPSVTFSTGIDTNVFNEPDEVDEDVVTRIRPQAEGTLRIGRAQLRGRGGFSAVHYRRYESQRSFDVAIDTRMDVDLGIVAPYVSYFFVRTRERTGFEIDSRPLRLDHTGTAGLATKLGARTTFIVGGYRSKLEYDEEATVEGALLQLGLNHERMGLTTGLRFAVTPITTLTLTADAERDRFEFSPLRNADGLRIAPGVEFNPGGLLAGRAMVGYRKFTPLFDAVPPYTGVVAGVDLGYTLRAATRFAVKVNRDTTYSFDPVQPYYVLTAVDGTISHHLTDRLVLTGTAGWQQLDYQVIAIAPGPGRIDNGRTFFASLLYATSRNITFGGTVDYARRDSALATRRYEGLRFNLLVNYGQ
jgi:hypothetical protein